MSEKNVRITTYGNFGRAFSVDYKPDAVKSDTLEFTLSPKAAKMIYEDLKKVIEGKQ